MSWRIKRIDPFWIKHPAVQTTAVAAALATVIAGRAGSGAGVVICALACASAVVLATKPALSGLFAVLGFLGGAYTFFLGPGGGLSPFMRVAATFGFSALYMVLMDGVVLSVSSVYNLFTRRLGFSGLSLSLDA